MAGARTRGLALTAVSLSAGIHPGRSSSAHPQLQLNKNEAHLKMRVILLPHLDRIVAGSAG
jgi:hypothetical protein